MKDYEPQLEGLLSVFLQDFRETDSPKLELVKTMFVQLYQDENFKTKTELLERTKKEKTESEGKKFVEQLRTEIINKNWMEVLQYTEQLKIELQEALNNVEKDYWETFLSMVIKQNEQIQ